MPSRDIPAGTALTVEQLLASNSALRREISALRDLQQDRAGLELLVAQLREANQNLVLATVSAQTLRDEAEATNLRQNEFLAMLAHELRNPLAPISMAATLIGKIPDATPQLRNLQITISRQVAHLSRLLNDLLDAARISSGKVTLMTQPVLLAEVLRRAVELIRPQLTARAQEIALHLPPDDLVIEGDQVRLAQVFSNLLVNASKYTQDQGRITLLVTVRGNQVDIALADNGDGIAAEILPHVFSLFTQGPRSLDRAEGGLGIGLNVVQNIVELHGGSVTAASGGIGNGSIFTVTLPLSEKLPPVAPPAASASSAGVGYRILLVEDNVDASDMLQEFLELEGHVVSTAYNGVNGLAMARDRVYDVLICDIGLPGMNGFELITELRESVDTHIPFAIALSGYGRPQDRARAIMSGFGHYFVKPVDIEALVKLIASNAVSKLVDKKD